MIGKLGDTGRKYAQAEHDYKVHTSKRILLRREEGMAATIMKDIVMGEAETAKLRLERDIAEVMYKTALESINAEKLVIRVLDEQLDREWNRSGNSR
jgi:hypothetical protein